MNRKRKTHILIEIITSSVVLFFVNLVFFPQNPGFSSIYGIPYLTLALFFAGYTGLLPALANLALSVFLVTLPFPFLAEGFAGISSHHYWRTLYRENMISLAVALIIIYVFSMLQKRYEDSNRRLKAKFHELSKTKHLLMNKVKALETVNGELEKRVSGQQESITAIYNQIKKIETVSVSTVHKVLIETVQMFLKAKRVSIWKYMPAAEQLKLVQSVGWEEYEHPTTELPEEGSIEGWVVRNNQLFSLRMLMQYENLRRIDRGNNILTLPIHTGTHLWGILNIGEMPFTKYNLYSEQILYIIVSLFEPALEKAVEYESIIRKDEIDADTGLPLFSSFFNVLKEEVLRMSVEKGKLSIIIVELLNYNDLVRQFSEHKVRGLMGSIAKVIGNSTRRQGWSYHYKEENQLSFIFSNLDYDGASLYCLEILEKMNTSDWSIDHFSISLEVVIGYSSYTGNETETELITKAENLIEMQKL